MSIAASFVGEFAGIVFSLTTTSVSVRYVPLHDLLIHVPFPEINATLNGISAVLLLAGFIAIKAKAVRTHAALMLSAFGTSTVFLAFYLTYHAMHGTTTFPKENPWRIAYYWILGTHTVLAVVVVPLILVTLWRAYRRQWAKHRSIAWVTFPIWLYVSVTGVIIYWLLYQVAGAIR